MSGPENLSLGGEFLNQPGEGFERVAEDLAGAAGGFFLAIVVEGHVDVGGVRNGWKNLSTWALLAVNDESADRAVTHHAELVEVGELVGKAAVRQFDGSAYRGLVEEVIQTIGCQQVFSGPEAKFDFEQGSHCLFF